MTDPHHDQRLSEPVTRYPEGSGGMWSWIAGVAVLVLIVIILIAGWNSHTHTASNPLPAATTGSATFPALKPPVTTGSAVQHPVTPAKPAMPKTGTQ